MVLKENAQELDTQQNLGSKIPFKGTIGPKEDSNIFSEILKVLLEICEDCKVKMACFHPSAFYADDIREAVKMSGRDKDREEPKPHHFYDDKSMELNPVKYNSKLMNSIWGYYNRYSPHNVKKNNDAADNYAAGQKFSASAIKADSMNSMNRMWSAIKASQSH